MQIDIQIRDKRYYLHILRLKSFCQKVIQNAWKGNDEAELSLVLADDDFVQSLNKQYRHQDKPTNVLSFENEGIFAGDIVVAYQTTKKEAKEKDVSFSAHLAHLLTHGTLHLQGYDHLNDKQADKMEKLEVKLLKKLGYDNPYKEI
ncbi:MAG: rRNA maturation RNase YbeY [Alphaproteobacteria bacterium]|nr:rRNA maturation RNase YbeY [Alphaproteobacteria bacterium]